MVATRNDIENSNEMEYNNYWHSALRRCKTRRDDFVRAMGTTGFVILTNVWAVPDVPSFQFQATNPFLEVLLLRRRG
jgi:hypothetical protein